MSWTETTIAGHACHLYEPATPSEHGDTVLYLHGINLGLLSDHPPFMREFDRHGLRVIAPITQRSWWADRICPEFDANISAEQYLLEHVMPSIAKSGATPQADDLSSQSRQPTSRRLGARTQVALLGISMGGQGALRLAYKHPSKFPVVAAISPSIDFQIRIEEGDPLLAKMYRDAEDARQDTATLHIHPLNWPRHQWFSCDPADLRWHDSVDRLRMKLFSLGVPFECDLETSAGGHTWEYFERIAELAISFLVEGLERERLRVE